MTSTDAFFDGGGQSTNAPYAQTWDEISKIVKFYATHTPEENVVQGHKFHRDPKVESAYTKHKQASSSGKDELLSRIFTEKEAKQGVSFRLNRFPYWTKPDVVHGLVWYRSDLGLSLDRSTVQQVFDQAGVEACFYENPPVWKTIPEVGHYHVFIHNPERFDNDVLVTKLSAALRSET